MPKLFVASDYVDKELQKLRQELLSEIAELRAQLAGGNALIGRSGTAESQVSGKQMQPLDVTGSASFGLVAEEEDSPKEVEITVTSSNPRAPGPSRSYSEVITTEPDYLQVMFDKKSAWSVPLVLFLAPGRMEGLIASLLLLVNAAMQALFSYIIFSNEFLGDDFSQKRGEATTWRRSYAHDYKYMDLTDTSLASRVCDEDGSLIFSNLQATLVEDINHFLGLQVMEFELGSFQPGVLLAVLCIFLWNLCVFKELRTISQLMRVVIHMPKASVTSFSATQAGRFVAMAPSRCAMMSVVCLGRAIIAGVLLLAGSVWLARTTSISELMLNAVALESVLHVDEFLFSSFMPTLIQHAVQNLGPAEIPHSRRGSRTETLMLLAVLVTAAILPYTMLVEPLSAEMLATKNELCGGNLTFVVGFNTDVQQTIGRRTRAVDEEEANLTIIEQAVAAHINHNGSVPARLIDFRPDQKAFDRWMQQTMEEYTGHYMLCWEPYLDVMAAQGRSAEGVLNDLFKLHTASAAVSLGMPENSSCADMAHLCDLGEARLLRFACGHTCGCDSLESSNLYRVRAYGCAQGCIMNLYEMQAWKWQGHRGHSFRTNCKNQPIGPGWEHFWDEMVSAFSYDINIQYMDITSIPLDWIEPHHHSKKIGGCEAIRHARVGGYFDITGTQYCQGEPGLFRPLAWLCPEACGCDSSGDPERDEFCFGYDYCPFSVPGENKSRFKDLAVRLGVWDSVMDAPRLQQ